MITQKRIDKAAAKVDSIQGKLDAARASLEGMKAKHLEERHREEEAQTVRDFIKGEKKGRKPEKKLGLLPRKHWSPFYRSKLEIYAPEYGQCKEYLEYRKKSDGNTIEVIIEGTPALREYKLRKLAGILGATSAWQWNNDYRKDTARCHIWDEYGEYFPVFGGEPRLWHDKSRMTTTIEYGGKKLLLTSKAADAAIWKQHYSGYVLAPEELGLERGKYGECYRFTHEGTIRGSIEHAMADVVEVAKRIGADVARIDRIVMEKGSTSLELAFFNAGTEEQWAKKKEQTVKKTEN
ncbi:Uncharacterised protein [uncultured archaeon]|nr:Uncharacterised protein [uncultured archaeon]